MKFGVLCLMPVRVPPQKYPHFSSMMSGVARKKRDMSKPLEI